MRQDNMGPRLIGATTFMSSRRRPGSNSHKQLGPDLRRGDNLN